MKNNTYSHSKYRNTGIIFEVLVRQVVTDVLHNNDPKYSYDIIKKHFKRGTELHEEFKLYRLLVETDEYVGDKIKSYDKFLNVVLNSRSKLNDQRLEREKHKLIAEVKKYYNLKELFKTRIGNYKILASIYKLFDNSIFESPKRYMDHYNTVCEFLEQGGSDKNMLEESDKNEYVEMFRDQDDDLKPFILDTMLSNYEEKYNSLNEDQRVLLDGYISVDVDSKSQIKEFNNTVISGVVDVKYKLNELAGSMDDKNPTKIKIKEVCRLSDDIIDECRSGGMISEDQLTAMLRFHKLIDLLERGEL